MNQIYNKTKYFRVIDDAKLMTSDILKKCKKKFKIWSYWNNEELDKNFPKPGGKTIRYFKRNIEADKELANLSAKDLDEMGIKGITLFA